MLGKLIKHEFKATARSFFPIYIVLFVVTIFMKLMREIPLWMDADGMVTNLLGGFAMLSFVISIIAVILGTVILIIRRFYNNMLKDEGYLSFTLPASVGQHIASKALVSYVWILVSGVMVILSILVIPAGHEGGFKSFADIIKKGAEIVSANGWWGYVFEGLAAFFIIIYASIMLIYTCLSIGQNFSKHRVGGSIVAYIGIYTVSQICNSIFVLATIGNNLNNDAALGQKFVFSYLTYMLILGIFESLVFTVITHLMLSRRLNLE